MIRTALIILFGSPSFSPSLASKSLAENNKKLLGPQLTLETGATDRLPKAKLNLE
jgi:hypothetical protein